MQKKFLINAVKTNKRASFLIVLLLVFYGHLLAGNNFSSDYADNLKINNTGMMVLGTWANVYHLKMDRSRGGFLRNSDR